MESILDLKKGSEEYRATLSTILAKLILIEDEYNNFVKDIEYVSDDELEQANERLEKIKKAKEEILTEEVKTFLFRHILPTTKEDVLVSVDNYRERIKKQSIVDKSHTAAFYHAIDNIAERFYQTVNKTHLFTRLEGGWCYKISLSNSGFELLLQYVEDIDYHPINFSCVVGESFSLIKTQCRLLSVTEYGEQYGIDQGTIRQWIRRCKLRAAVKKGTEWFIPEFEDVPRRGFTPARYYWNEILYNLPEEYTFLERPGELLITQDKTDKKKYKLVVLVGHSKTYEEEMSEEKREQVERFLIAHPQIKYKMLDGNLQ